jgi:hypothetical protein
MIFKRVINKWAVNWVRVALNGIRWRFSVSGFIKGREFISQIRTLDFSRRTLLRVVRYSVIICYLKIVVFVIWIIITDWNGIQIATPPSSISRTPATIIVNRFLGWLMAIFQLQRLYNVEGNVRRALKDLQGIACPKINQLLRCLCTSYLDHAVCSDYRILLLSLYISRPSLFRKVFQIEVLDLRFNEMYGFFQVMYICISNDPFSEIG